MMMKVALLAALLLPLVNAQSIICPRNVSEPQASIRLRAETPSGKNFNEISGLALSPTQKAPSGEPVLYGVNDSGGGRRLGVFDAGTGERLLTLRMPFIPSIIDFESLAIGSCGSTGVDDTCIYIADVGDNAARGEPLGTKTQRNNTVNTPCQIFKFREPTLGDFVDQDEIPQDEFFTLLFDYRHETSPTEFADSEAIFLDHTGWGGGEKGDIYVITKWNWGSDSELLTRLFRIPASAWPASSNGAGIGSAVYSPAAVGTGGGNLGYTWTSADMSLDGTVIGLGDFWETVFFLRCPGVSVAEALDDDYCHSWYLTWTDDADQYETFAWSPDGSSVLQISECGSGCDPPMSWTTLEYDPTSMRTCPEVEWALDDDTWYCRALQDDSVVPDAWCEDRNLVQPDVAPTPSVEATTPAPSPLPSAGTPAPVDSEGSSSVSYYLETASSKMTLFLLSCALVLLQ